MIQGVAGGIFPLSFGIVRDEFPREKVAGSIGFLSAVLGIGAGLGILAGGLIVEHLSWQWLFWMPLVVIVAAALGTWRYVPESPVRVPGRVNWLAALLMSTGITAVLLGVSEATTWGWGSTRTIGLIGAGLLLCAAWVVVEIRSREPLIDMGMMRIRARLDDEPDRVPARRRNVRLVHHLPAVRAAADEHRLRLRGLGRRVRALPAPLDARDGRGRVLRRLDREPFRLEAGA